MGSNYDKIVEKNIQMLFSRLPPDLVDRMGAEREGESFGFQAFGEACRLSSEGITFSGEPVEDPRGLLVSLYALTAGPGPMEREPFKAFKDLPGSMPYQGAFGVNSERVLVPHVLRIQKNQTFIKEAFDGEKGIPEMGGDFSFILYPLPKIALSYIFYLPDEEFPPSVTCLFSANALSFMPLDGLADVAEYTSKGILRITGR